MAMPVDRSVEARVKRKPHVFLSHSAKDKEIVRELASDLNRLGIDAWLDEWELKLGDSLHTTIAQALEHSQYVAVLISEHFLESKWANDELIQALSRERREDRSLVLPLIIGNARIPAFIEDRIHLDFRSEYYISLTQLAGMIHGVSNIRIQDAIQTIKPRKLKGVIKALSFAGHDDLMVLDSADCEEILNAGGWMEEGTVCFYPDEILGKEAISDRLRNIMKDLRKEGW